jgi:hypothetical protein
LQGIENKQEQQPQIQRRGTLIISLNGDEILYKGKGRQETIAGEESNKNQMERQTTGNFTQALQPPNQRNGNLLT